MNALNGHDFARRKADQQQRYTFSRSPTRFGWREQRVLRFAGWLYVWIWWRPGDI